MTFWHTLLDGILAISGGATVQLMGKRERKEAFNAQTEPERQVWLRDKQFEFCSSLAVSLTMLDHTISSTTD
jgi:hypothetical protein